MVLSIDDDVKNIHITAVLENKRGNDNFKRLKAINIKDKRHKLIDTANNILLFP